MQMPAQMRWPEERMESRMDKKDNFDRYLEINWDEIIKIAEENSEPLSIKMERISAQFLKETRTGISSLIYRTGNGKRSRFRRR